MQYTIDRFEGNFAVCQNETGEMVDILIEKLPKGVGEGDCISENEGIYAIDRELTDYKTQEILKRMEDLWK